ncbi:MAG TPA: hypothetical protein VEL76_35840 [Gemmataceae bacterium]|nr:hypothetical protein [Gemmataceae bacterium]
MRRVVVLSVAALLWLGWVLSARAQEDESRAVVAKAIKAMGGEKLLASLKAAHLKAKGKAHMPMEFPFTAELLIQEPDKTKFVIDAEIMGMNIQVIRVVNGKKGWESVLGMTKELDAQDIEEAQAMMKVEQVIGLVVLKDKRYKLSPLGEAKVEGRDAVGVQVTKKGVRDVNLFFDKQNHMLVKAEYRALDPNKQEVTQEKIFPEYKTLGSGLKVPAKMILNNDGKRFIDAEITDVTIVERHDDSVFAKP